MIESMKAGTEIVQNRFVKITGGELELCSSSTDNIIGICLPQLGEFDGYADVAMSETTEVEAGAAFEAGAALTSDADGCAVAAASGGNIGAIALEDAQNPGDIVRVLVCLQRGSFDTETSSGTDTTE